MSATEVVFGWGAGRFTFRHRWAAALFRFALRRCSGWTHWDYLSDDERAASFKPGGKRRRP